MMLRRWADLACRGRRITAQSQDSGVHRSHMDTDLALLALAAQRYIKVLFSALFMRQPASRRISTFSSVALSAHDSCSNRQI